MREGEGLMPSTEDLKPDTEIKKPKSGPESLGDHATEIAQNTERDEQLLGPIVEALESGDQVKILALANKLSGEKVTNDPEDAERRLKLNRKVLEDNIQANREALERMGGIGFLSSLRNKEKSE